MKIIKSVSLASLTSSNLRSKNKKISLVPTMGYLHEGHLSLIDIARRRSDVVFVSIFVNPLQFGPKEDFEIYPRDFRRDEKLCRERGVDYIFYPELKSLYPNGYSTYIEVERMSNLLEGKPRPGHFRGVTTIVLKLFNIINPHIAVFGQKDAQQLCIIKRMVKDLNLNIKILTGKIIRDKDKLALSSRNIYLTEQQREDATILYKALKIAEQKILSGYSQDFIFLKRQMSKLIRGKHTVSEIDYISFNDSDTLREFKSLKEVPKNTDLLISLAVRFGKTRLIDNIVIKY